jgi:hypothetical protein
MASKISQKQAQIEDFFLESTSVAMIWHDVVTISKLDSSIEFKESYDDFDDVQFASLHLNSGSIVRLVHHKHSSAPGLEIFVRCDEYDIAWTIGETLHNLNLIPDDLIWIHPKLKESFYSHFNESFCDYFEEQEKHKKLFCKVIGGLFPCKIDPSKSLAGADLKGAALKKARLRQFNLSHTLFQGAELSLASLQGANLEAANLCDADLRSANIQKAILKEAILQGANLGGADLQYANLTRADLSGADLQRANLKNADLSFSILSNATFLVNADIGGAHLNDIQWNQHTKWFNIIGLHKAINVPKELKEDSDFRHGVKLSEGIEEISTHGNLNKFKEIYRQVLTEITDDEVAASLWNKIAWLTCLYAPPDNECHMAAKKAIELVGSKGNYHDTLGLVLVSREEYPDAIHEFEIALESCDVKEWPQDFVSRRRGWIDALKSGKNPLDESVLEILRTEEP